MFCISFKTFPLRKGEKKNPTTNKPPKTPQQQKKPPSSLLLQDLRKTCRKKGEENFFKGEKGRKKVLGFGFKFFSYQQKLKPSERW